MNGLIREGARPLPALWPWAAATALLVTIGVAAALMATRVEPQPRSAVDGQQYSSSAFGYAIDLPLGWRRSDRLSMTRSAGDLLGQDIFTIRGAADEQKAIAASDFMGPAYSHALVVQVWSVSPDLTPLQAVQRGYAGARLGQIVSATTLAGLPAVKVENGAQYTLSYYLVRSEMLFIISYLIPQDASWHPAGATEAQLRGMIASLRFQ